MNNTVNVNENTGFNPQTGEFGSIPKIIRFEANKNSVSDLTPVLLNWEVEGAEEVFFEDELTGNVGNKSLNILSPTSLKLRATNSFGFVEEYLKIEIENIIPIITRFKADRSVIAEGQKVVIRYSTKKTLRAELNGNPIDLSKNKIEVKPIETTTYQLTVYSLTNEVKSKNISIKVIPMPKIEITFPTPNFTISFNRRAVGTQLPEFNLMFPFETGKLTKINEELLQSKNAFEVEHTLTERILKTLKKIFLIVSIIAISVVFGFYFGITSNH